MAQNKLEAQKITRPIQLLAAWLVGLLLLDGAFLTSAKILTKTSWLPALLVIASIIKALTMAKV